ncbi:MAG: aldehyde ferredoxin oxidoreductase N-terminal domain-containing protein, partial [Candidatus Bathyarchaeia archaeon]
MFKGGYVNRILKVDLNKEKVDYEEINKEYALNYIGGAGYAARILYDLIKAETDPLGPDNALFFTAGPMVGSTFPGGTKWTICFKSPLTGIWGESSASGFFGAELKRSGFDGILITGRSSSPVYLQIVDGECEFVGAESLWGMDTYQTCLEVKSKFRDSSMRVACVGPAGERLVRISSVITDEGRVCGRAGVGAVMGSKNLKAVAVRGHGQIPLTDLASVRELSDKARRAVKPPEAP